MSKNINQVFIANPITTNLSTDLMYFGRSPYGATDDAGMSYANFSAQFTLKTLTSAHIFVGNGSNVATDVALSGDATIANTGAITVASIGGKAVSLANSFTTSGNFTVIQTYTGATNVTFPTTGTLATTSQIPSLPLSLANGGTNASLVASNGGIFYSTGSAGAILSGTATANQVLLSGASTTPAFSTATYPPTTTINQLLYSSSANTIVGLATGNSGVLITSAGGIPSISSTLPSTVQSNITALGTIASGVWNGTIITGTFGGTGVNNGASTITIGGNVTMSGAFTFTGTITANTSVTFPTSGTLATTAQSFIWNDVSGTTQAASGNNGYIISNAGQTTVTIPATIAEGQVIGIAGKGAAGWVLQANTGQTIHFGSSASTSAGSLTSTNQWDSVQIVCVTANTVFSVISSVGNLTVA